MFVTVHAAEHANTAVMAVSLKRLVVYNIDLKLQALRIGGFSVEFSTCSSNWQIRASISNHSKATI